MRRRRRKASAPAGGTPAAPGDPVGPSAGGPTEAIIDLWRDPSSPDFGYFERVETYTDDFWRPGAQFRTWFDRLDVRNVLEIACGQGRHAEQAAPLCGALLLSDTSREALEHAARRLRGHPHVRTVLSPDGLTVPVAEDGQFSAVYCYDAMVHFEADCVASYLDEIARLLEPGGMALLHHSNYDAQPGAAVTDAPGWRNYMTVGLLAHLASRRGLEVVQQEAFDWVAPLSDALTLLRKPSVAVAAGGAAGAAGEPAEDDEPVEHPVWARRLEQARDEVLPWIEETVPLDGLTVLEYGCGQGAVSCAVAARCARHIGIDINEGEIEVARGHAQRRGVTNTELHYVGVEEIFARVGEFSGQVDVFLLYAVLEHMSLDERLAVLRLAREVLREDGHIVICETPNRLVAFDHHTGQMPFLHALPRELAARYYSRSERPDFVEAVDAARVQGGEDAVHEALVRWGYGMSFHELELVFDDLPAHTVAANYHGTLYPGRPVRWEELQLSATLDAWRPDLPPCWSRSWLDMILSVRPQASPVEHVRPWALRLGADVAGAAVLPDARVELAAGARLPVALPAATSEIHVGLIAGEGFANALRIHLPDGRELSPVALESLYSIPTSHATVRLDAAVDRFELSLVDGGSISYVGYRGPADPELAQTRVRGW